MFIVWRLVREKISVCDESGMSRAASTDGRYPVTESYENVTSPASSSAWRLAIGSISSPSASTVEMGAGAGRRPVGM